MHHRVGKDLSTSCVAKNHSLTWKMSAFYFVKLYILFSASNDGVGNATIKLNIVCFKVSELSGNDLYFLVLNEVVKLVDDYDVSDLVVFASKTKVLAIVRYAY
jgi:hypothetical protein